MVELILKDEVEGGTFRWLLPKNKILGVFIEDDGTAVIVLEKRKGIFGRKKVGYYASAETFDELKEKLVD